MKEELKQLSIMGQVANITVTIEVYGKTYTETTAEITNIYNIPYRAKECADKIKSKIIEEPLKITF
jgi:hypothetical protein